MLLFSRVIPKPTSVLNYLLLSILIHSHNSNLLFHLEPIDCLQPNKSFQPILPGLFQHILLSASYLHRMSHRTLKFNLPRIHCIILHFLLCFLSYFWCQCVPTIQARKPGDDSSFTLLQIITKTYCFHLLHVCTYVYFSQKPLKSYILFPRSL